MDISCFIQLHTTITDNISARAPTVNELQTLLMISETDIKIETKKHPHKALSNSPSNLEIVCIQLEAAASHLVIT